MHTLEIVEIEKDSLGIILPNAWVERMQVGAGDVLYLTEGPDQSVLLTPFDPAVTSPDASES